MAEAFDLSPFERLRVLIRSCATYMGELDDACGNFSDFKLRAQVEGEAHSNHGLVEENPR